MWKILAAATAVFALIAGCGDDDGAEGAQQFCAAFERQPGVGTGLGNEAAMEEALTFFRALEDDAPEEVATQVGTLATGVESIVDAFDDFEGADGTEALQAVEEASGVSLDELEQAADDVEQYAAENCEDVEATG